MELNIQNCSKSYGKVEVIKEISYTMDYGVYGLLGVNGVGKTTLIRMICTLLQPSSGIITWQGKDIFKLGAEYRNILGYLPQEFGFYPDLSVYDYMMYIASIKGLMPRTAKKRINQLLDQVAMLEHKNKKMGRLSGGMQRRVGIAQAMLNNPQILILDEPTAGLDPNERIRFRNLISELSEDRLVLLSTHIVSDIAYIAKEILLMNKGRIMISGNHSQIISSMDKKVWQCRVDRENVEYYSQHYLIANMKTGEQLIEMRIISEQAPNPQAILVEPTLEDAFLSYFGERKNDKI